MKIKKISVHAYDQHLVKPIEDLADIQAKNASIVARVSYDSD